ncbi:MAG: hypothetical protein MUD12_06680 [Spirochaetes bacterium]|jgi:hypothetical protein|nr:hypothetical protein [Spirochaetota bacterium]
MENREQMQIPPELVSKVRLVRTGLYCFISCLSGCIVTSASSAPFEIIGGPVFSVIGSFLTTLAVILFAGCFASFGILLTGLLKKPSATDVGPYMSSALSGVVVIFTAGGCFFVLIIIGMLAALTLSFYADTGGLILLSITYFLFSTAFFFIAHSFILAGNILKKNEHPDWLKRIASKLGSAGGEKPVSYDEGKKIIGRDKMLSVMEKVLGTALGLVLFILMGAADYTGLVGKFLGSEAEEKAETALSSTEIILAALSLFIFIFSTMFVVKTIRSIVNSKLEIS